MPPPCTAPGPHQAVRAHALAPCAAGPGSHLLEAARAPAEPEEPPSQTEAEGRVAFLEKQWRSGSHATGRVRQEWGLQKRVGLAPSPLHGGIVWPSDHNFHQNGWQNRALGSGRILTILSRHRVLAYFFDSGFQTPACFLGSRGADPPIQHPSSPPLSSAPGSQLYSQSTWCSPRQAAGMGASCR